MVNVSDVYLQRDHLGKSTDASKLCLKAAHTTSSHIRHLKEEDYQFLDPIISVSFHSVKCRLSNLDIFCYQACWKTVGRLYIHLLVISDKSNNRAREMHGLARELHVVIFALKKLGNVFPIAGMIVALRYANLMHKVNRQLFNTGQHAAMLEQERADRCLHSVNASLPDAPLV
jgi:hypothetical protein